jgi:IclR family pca regulon transcriptional regulator
VKQQQSTVKRAETLVKGLEILQLFAAHPKGLRLPEITRLTGLPKATAYRFLQTLLDQNYLHYSPSTGVFRLGPKVMSLGYSALLGFDLAELAGPYLNDLSKKIKENVNLGVLDGVDAVYLVRIRVHTIFSMNLTVGSRVASHNSAIGRALLAYLPEERLHAVIAQMGRDPKVAGKIGRSGEELKRHLEDVREKGYALADGEFVPGLASVAVPVFDAAGHAEAAINVPVYTRLCTVEKLIDEHLPFLLSTAQSISELRGYRASPAPGGAAAAGAGRRPSKGGKER